MQFLQQRAMKRLVRRTLVYSLVGAAAFGTSKVFWNTFTTQSPGGRMHMDDILQGSKLLEWFFVNDQGLRDQNRRNIYELARRIRNLEDLLKASTDISLMDECAGRFLVAVEAEAKSSWSLIDKLSNHAGDTTAVMAHIEDVLGGIHYNLQVQLHK